MTQEDYFGFGAARWKKYLADRLETLQHEIDLLSGVEDLAALIDALEASDAVQQANIAALEAEDVLQHGVDAAQDARLDTNDTHDAAVDVELAAHVNHLTSLDGDVSTLDARADANDVLDAAIGVELAAHVDHFAAIDALDVTQDAELASLQAQVDALEAQLEELLMTHATEHDAFGRLRISEARTLFDAKFLVDAQPLFWDDVQMSGGGTSSAHSVDRASVTMAVSNLTAGKRVRQTFKRFRYEPGKSQLFNATFVMGAAANGITRKVGAFDENNGVYFQQTGAGPAFVIRSHVTGATVDEVMPQASWNLDKLDGTGTSGVTLDLTKSQILMIDYQWLGTGAVRFGFNIGGELIYTHEHYNANVNASVWTSTADLPIRYSIENSGTGPAATFEQICSAVMSEGGTESVGVVRSVSFGSAHLDADVIGTLYAAVGLRLKSAYAGASVVSFRISDVATTPSDTFEWQLLLNPTVAGTFTYSSVANAALEYALGATANTVSGGTLIDSGFAVSQTTFEVDVDQFVRFGTSIVGTSDVVVVAIRPVIGSNQDHHTSVTWRELL